MNTKSHYTAPLLHGILKQRSNVRSCSSSHTAVLIAWLLYEYFTQQNAVAQPRHNNSMPPQMEEKQEADALETVSAQPRNINPAPHHNPTTEANTTRSIATTDEFTGAAEPTHSSADATAVTTDSIFDTDLPVHAIPDIDLPVQPTLSIAPVTTDSALIHEGQHAGATVPIALSMAEGMTGVTTVAAGTGTSYTAAAVVAVGAGGAAAAMGGGGGGATKTTETASDAAEPDYTPTAGSSAGYYGAFKQGNTVIASTNNITATSGEYTFSYQWQESPDGVDSLAGDNIAGATEKQFTIADDKSDVGKYIRGVIEAKAPNGNVIETFKGPWTLVQNVDHPAIGKPTISGTAYQGSTLQSNVAGLSDPDGSIVMETYQWQQQSEEGAWTNIAGETSDSFHMTTTKSGSAQSQLAGGREYVGKKIRLEVTTTDQYEGQSKLYSEPTTPIAAVNVASTGTVTVNGTIEQGKTLTIGTANLADLDNEPNTAPTIKSQQWMWSASALAEFTPIAGATNTTWAVTNDGQPQSDPDDVKQWNGDGQKWVGYEPDKGFIKARIEVEDRYHQITTLESLPYQITNVDEDARGAIILNTRSGVENDTNAAFEQGNEIEAMAIDVYDPDGYDPDGYDLLTDAEKGNSNLDTGITSKTYKWFKLDSANGSGTLIELQSESKYTLLASDADKWIKVIVTTTDTFGNESEFNNTIKVAANNQAPDGQVTLTGNIKQGSQIAVDITDLEYPAAMNVKENMEIVSVGWIMTDDTGDDPENDHWVTVPDSDNKHSIYLTDNLDAPPGNAVNDVAPLAWNGTGQQYVGHHISARVVAKAGDNTPITIFTMPQEVVNVDDPARGDITLVSSQIADQNMLFRPSDTVSINESLTDPDGTITKAYQWQKKYKDSNDWTDITGKETSQYTIDKADFTEPAVGSDIRVKITTTDELDGTTELHSEAQTIDGEDTAPVGTVTYVATRYDNSNTILVNPEQGSHLQINLDGISYDSSSAYHGETVEVKSIKWQQSIDDGTTWTDIANSSGKTAIYLTDDLGAPESRITEPGKAPADWNGDGQKFVITWNDNWDETYTQIRAEVTVGGKEYGKVSGTLYTVAKAVSNLDDPAYNPDPGATSAPSFTLTDSGTGGDPQASIVGPIGERGGIRDNAPFPININLIDYKDYDNPDGYEYYNNDDDFSVDDFVIKANSAKDYPDRWFELDDLKAGVPPESVGDDSYLNIADGEPILYLGSSTAQGWVSPEVDLKLTGTVRDIFENEEDFVGQATLI